MAYGYRRRGNTFGWLAFFGIGGAVFVGLALALLYLKEENANREKNAAGAMPRTDHPTLGRKPETVVKEKLQEFYKKQGKALESPKFGEPKEVMSQVSKHKVVIIQVQHREAGSEKPPTDQVFVLDRTKITAVNSKDWQTRKAELGIAEDPPRFVPPSE